MTAWHWVPTRSAAVMPTVQPRRAAMPTIWSVVWIAPGRRSLGIDSSAAASSNSFMPMIVVFRRSSAFRSSTSLGQS